MSGQSPKTHEDIDAQIAHIQLRRGDDDEEDNPWHALAAPPTVAETQARADNLEQAQFMKMVDRLTPSSRTAL